MAAGAAKMIVDQYVTAKELIQDISDLCDNRDTLHLMSEAAYSLGKPQAGQEIAKMALSLIQ